MAFIDTITWTAAGGLILAWLIVSNWMYCYYRLRHMEQIVKRRPRVVLIVAAVLFVDMMIKPWLMLSANGQLPTVFLAGTVFLMTFLIVRTLWKPLRCTPVLIVYRKCVDLHGCLRHHRPLHVFGGISWLYDLF